MHGKESIMNPYVWHANKFKKGFKVGELNIVSAQRQTGKSTFVYNILKQRALAWGEWGPVWSFMPKRSYTGKLIWGRIMARTHILFFNNDNTPVFQFASRKEVFLETLKTKHD